MVWKKKNNVKLKGNGYTSKGGNSVKTLLAHQGQFLPFQKWFLNKKANMKPQNFSPLKNGRKKSTKCMYSLNLNLIQISQKQKWTVIREHLLDLFKKGPTYMHTFKSDRILPCSAILRFSQIVSIFSAFLCV